MLIFANSYPPVAGIVFLILTLAIGTFFVWLAERSRLAASIQTCSGVVAPFGATLSVLFSLFMVFLVQDIWANRDRAVAAVAREADAVRQLGTVGKILGERGGAFNGLISNYAKTATDVNWRTPEQHRATQDAIQSLLREGLVGGLAGVEPLKGAALEAIGDLRAGYRDRSVVSDSPSARRKWVAAVILGIITQMGLVVVHLGKPRASMLVTILFGSAMAFVLWITLMRLDPFFGTNAISLAPIRTAAGLGP